LPSAADFELRMASAEQPVLSRWSERALPRHSYPLWVVVAAAITFVAAVYSFMQLQTLVDAAGNLRAGEKALAARDYTTAAVQLEAAHEQAPASRKITIYLATADFGLGDPASRTRAHQRYEVLAT
jgi:hypothetical protein